MRKILSLILAVMLVVSAFPSYAFEDGISLSESGNIYAQHSEYMDFESFRAFEVTKISAGDEIEVIINGESCLVDSSTSQNVTLDLTKYITHTGLNSITLREIGNFESEYSFETIITKNSFIVGYQTDYEEFEIGDEDAIKTLDSEGMTIRTNTGYAKIDTIDGEHGNSLVYGLENPSATKSPFVANKTTASSGIYEYEFDMYIDRTDLNFRLNSRYNDTSGATQILPMFNCIKGNLRLYDASAWKVHGTISARTWYTFRYILDYTNLTYDLYLNDTLLVQGYTMNMPNFKSMNDHMRLEVEVTPGNSNFIAWDNFTYRQIIAQPYIEYINNGDALDTSSESFDVKLSGEYDDITEVAVSLSRNGNPAEIASVNLNGDVLSVTPAYPLAPGSEYKLLIKKGVETIDGVTTDIATAGTFETLPADIDLKNAKITGNYSFSGEVIGKRNVDTVMYLKDSDGRLISYVAGSSLANQIFIGFTSENGSSETLLHNGKPVDATAFALFDGKPVGEKLYSTSGVKQSEYSGSSTGMKNISYDNTDKSITLYGSYPGGDDKLLVAHIYPKSGSGKDAYYAFLTGRGGGFCEKILLPENFGGGKYIADLIGSEDEASMEFTYINEDELSEILSEVNGAESSEAMRTIILQKRNALGIDESFGDDDINLIADMIYANRKNGYSNDTLSNEISADSAAILIKNGASAQDAIGAYASAFKNDNCDCALLCTLVSDSTLEKVADILKNADLLEGTPFADMVAQALVIASITEAESGENIKNTLFGSSADVLAYMNIDSSEYDKISDKEAVYAEIYDRRTDVSDVESAKNLIETVVHEQYEYETSPQSPVNFPDVSAQISAEMTTDMLSKVVVEASDPNGNIAAVCGYINGTLVATVTSEPYELDLSDGIASFGHCEIKITAEDNDGNIAESIYSTNIIRTADYGEFETDFEEYSPGSSDAISDLTNGKISLNSGNGGYTKIVNFGDEHGNVLCIGKERGSKPASTVFFGNNTYSKRGIYTYEFDVYFSRTDMGGNLTTRYLKTDGSAGFLYFANIRKDTIVLKDGKSDGASVKITAENWHRFKMILDYSNLTFDFYWDGELVAEDYSFGCDDFVSMNNHTRLEMRFGELDVNEEGFVAIDNYSYVHNVEYPSVSMVYAETPGEDKVDYTSEKINILLTDGFENADLSKVFLYRDGMNVPLGSVCVSGKNNELVTIEPEYPLASSAKYVVVFGADLITLDGYTMDYETNAEFETSAADFDLTGASFDFSKKHMTFNATMVNTTADDKTVTAIVNIFDERGVYDSYVTKTITARSGENTPVSISADAGDKYTAKVFFVENLDSMKFVFDNIYSNGSTVNSAISNEKPASLTLTPSYSDETKLLSIFGATPLDAGNAVVFSLENGSEAVVYDAVIASVNGAYLTELKLKSDLHGGKYTITAVSGEYSKNDSFMYINESEAASALNAVNSSSADNIEKVLADNSGKLGIDEEIFKKDSSGFAAYVYANKPSKGYSLNGFADAVGGASAGVLIKSGTDIEDVLARYGEVLEGCAQRYDELDESEKSAFASNISKADLASGDSFDIIFTKTQILTELREATSWYDLKTVVLGTDYNGIKTNNNFEIINPDTSKYKSVSDKNAVFEKMYVSRKTLSDFDDIAVLFEKSAKDVYDSEKKSDSSKGSGGGGGGGGGGGSVSMAPVASVPTPAQPTPAVQIQTDISGHWAEAIIAELDKMGIMNGYGNGIYRPDSFITRSEFVKLMLVAFNIPTSSASGFSDVSPDAWYAPYVGGAYAKGLVNGTSADEFSPESHITRQDAAVIAERYLSGICHLEASANSFDDSSDIADYAEDSVLKLKGALIIKGNGNNTFNPTSNITRAEAASLILGILTYTQAH